MIDLKPGKRVYPCVYCIRCPYTLNVRYIGKTETPVERKKQHLYLATFKDLPLYNWIRCLGKEPIFEILEPADSNAKALDLERKYFMKYQETGLLLNQKTLVISTPDYINATNKLILESGISKQHIALMIGIRNSTLSKVLAGKYTGSIRKILDLVNTYLEGINTEDKNILN